MENTHEPIVSEDDFFIVQNLLKTDGRKSMDTGNASPFMGLLFCGDCGEQMVRRVNRYKDTVKVYYICSTKNRGDGCSRHSIEEQTLKGIVTESVRHYANTFLKEKQLFERSVQFETNFESVSRYDKEIDRLKREQDKYYKLCSGLYEDLSSGIITKEEFERLHGGFWQKARKLEEAMKKQEQLIKEMFKKGVLSAGRLKTFQDCVELKEIDRRSLCSMVKRIEVYENRQIEIEFYFSDIYRVMTAVNQKIRMDKSKLRAVERSA